MFFVGAVGAFCMHLLLATSFISPIMILLVYGSCHGLFLGALQPAVALLVNPDEVGLAFGIYSALNCLGVSLVPPIVGYILDKNTQNVMLPSGDVTTKTDVNGYIQAEYVLLSFVGVSVLLSIVFLIADQKILQGVVFATPAERLEIFRLKDGAQAHADGNKKEEMEQRIRDTADALLTAYSQRLTTKNGDVSEVKPLDASIGGRVIEADLTTMDVEDVHRIYSSMSVEPLSAS
jgi:MFS family permease